MRRGLKDAVVCARVKVEGKACAVAEKLGRGTKKGRRQQRCAGKEQRGCSSSSRLRQNDVRPQERHQILGRVRRRR